MNNYQIPGFAAIDLDNLNDYYNAHISFQEHDVQLDITFDEYTVDRQKLETIATFVTQLDSFHQKAVAAMQQEYLSGTVVQSYIDKHRDLFAKQQTTENTPASREDEAAQLIAKLYLKRIGFYPENESEFAIFDYTIEKDETRYLVVVNFKKDGTIDGIVIDN